MACQAGGRLIVSIDLELDHHPGSLRRQQTLDALTTQLLALLDELEIPATFAVADPRYSAATEAIMASPVRHEVAVLADATWAGPGCGRERFARELSRRFGTARSAGLAVSTLALRQVELTEHADLLGKTGITALRGNFQGALPQVWNAPPVTPLPHRNGWWFESGELTAYRALQRAIRQQGLTHWLLDASTLIDQPASNWRAVVTALDAAACARAAGKLQIGTLQSFATEPVWFRSRSA